MLYSMVKVDMVTVKVDMIIVKVDIITVKMETEIVASSTRKWPEQEGASSCSTISLPHEVFVFKANIIFFILHA